MDKGYKGMLSHVSKKLLSSFGDGTFGHKASHGGMVRDVPTKNHFSLVLRDLFRSNGQYYDWIAAIRQVVWIMVLFLNLVVIFVKPKEDVISVAKVCIIGMFLYEVFFEANSHHAFDMISIFTLLAAVGMNYVSALKSIADKN